MHKLSLFDTSTNKRVGTRISRFFQSDNVSGLGRGVRPFTGYKGVCSPKGCGFLAVSGHFGHLILNEVCVF